MNTFKWIWIKPNTLNLLKASSQVYIKTQWHERENATVHSTCEEIIVLIIYVDIYQLIARYNNSLGWI